MLQGRTLAAGLSAAIRNDILTGFYKAGDPLRQEQLAERYQVSRIPVREALLQLESQGLVAVMPHRGFVVRAMSAVELKDIYHIRMVIEPDLVADATRSPAAQKLFIEAKKVLDDSLKAMADKGPSDEYSALHQRFHGLLIEGSNRVRSIEVVKRMHTLCERYIRLHLSLHQGRPNEEHNKIIEACLAGDAEAARHHVLTHLECTMNDLLEELDTDPVEDARE
ncbi:GntR family transcriptional regulator [Woodsholea maritima]|uniref:GntR family transcriptional regulator n=1 Tax=Woodsholea maritima TaxID=240237 RepID=UPI00037DC335|nr:GntR family transcriptional regulator [Woodsholea maritima]